MSQPDTVAQVTVTQRLVAKAAARGPVVALRGGIGPADTYSYARLGITVQVAA